MAGIEKIKEIIALFLKTDKNSITSATVIDKTAIRGSIMIRRMYSAISEELGHAVPDSGNIKTFGDLIDKLDPDYKNGSYSQVPGHRKDVSDDVALRDSAPYINGLIALGVDIEEIGNLPQVEDYRENSFYRDNFSQVEISYCIQQQDPITAFAGKFAAKEAIIKADNFFKNIPFREIEIKNEDTGKPYFNGFALSISHSGRYAVAVAVKLAVHKEYEHDNRNADAQSAAIAAQSNFDDKWPAKLWRDKFALIALILSGLTLFVVAVDKFK